MPLSEQCQKDLNQIFNHLRMVGVNMMAARRAFEKSGDTGVAAMLRAEAMERYKMAGEIADYLVVHDAPVNYGATPAASTTGANLKTLQAIVPMDSQTVEALGAMATAANARGAHATARFMTHIMEYAHKEYKEIHSVVGDVAKLAADPGAMILYDLHLCEEYKDKYGGYDMC